ncbi:hypothetical protein [Niallia nealsonii]|uniref:hypothetical protein n=1 Tax=Niallia nealsonii TaxID=115979 RepID=UPI001445C6BD|nr:hypothetical protein [Niallia nealsonii]
MDKVLERLKYQLENNSYKDEVLVSYYDLVELIQEYEIATGKKKRWTDERW